MKSKIIILLISLATSFVALANPGSTAYFICNFTDTLSSMDVIELNNNGFDIVESNEDNHTVYVVADTNANFTYTLKSKMKELIEVDKNGNRIYIIETVTEESPEFYKVFFNLL